MTSSDRWKRVQELYQILEPLPCDQHAEELRRIEPDTELAADVLRLFASADQEAQLQTRLKEDELRLCQGIGEPGAAFDLPGLKLFESLGSGGSGVVFRAIRSVNGIDQQVAVKVFHSHRAGAPESLARFTREQQILASLSDPRIVRFLDAGLTPDQRPYLVMELTEGQHITSYCDERRLNIRDRIGLLMAVCQAVASAHARLIVHLDLKPSNILVTPQGDVKLLDFGTAKILDTFGGFTVTEQLTPQYASPERLRGEPSSVSSDVYSLGLILFELVSGGWPFPARESVIAMADRASGTLPKVSPVDRVTLATAEMRSTSQDRLRSQLATDLACICSKALEFDQKDRYLGVTELAADLRRYLAGEPVSAHPPSIAYRTSKFLARYAGRLALAALFVTGLAAAAVFSAVQARRAELAANQAQNAQLTLGGILTISSTDATSRPDMTVLELLESAEKRVPAILGVDPALAADVELALGEGFTGHGAREQARRSLSRALRYARDSRDAVREAQALAALSYQSYLDNDLAASSKQASDAYAIWKRDRSAFTAIKAGSVLARAGTSLQYANPSDPSTREPFLNCLKLLPAGAAATSGLRATCLVGLADVEMFANYSYGKALSLLEEAMALQRQDSSSAGDLAVTLQLYGMANRFLRRYDDDERAQREGLEISARIHGPASLITANSRAVWATSLAGVGKAEQGIREAEKALKVYRREYPQPGSHLLWTPLSAAMISSCMADRFQDCERYAREALQSLGPHPASADTRLSTANGFLGIALANLGRDAEAKPLLEEVQALYRSQNRTPFHLAAAEAALRRIRVSSSSGSSQ